GRSRARPLGSPTGTRGSASALARRRGSAGQASARPRARRSARTVTAWFLAERELDGEVVRVDAEMSVGVGPCRIRERQRAHRPRSATHSLADPPFSRARSGSRYLVPAAHRLFTRDSKGVLDAILTPRPFDVAIVRADVLERAGDHDLLVAVADGFDPHGPRARLKLGVTKRDGSRAGVDHAVDPFAVPAHDHHDPVSVLGRAPLASPRAVERKAFLRENRRRGHKADPH